MFIAVIAIVTRTTFCVMLLLAALYAVASLLAYPGAFVLTAFSLGGLRGGIPSGTRTSLIAAALALVVCVIPVWILILSTMDGDFTVQSLVVQIVVLGLLAYGLAWLAMIIGRVVWMPWSSDASRDSAPHVQVEARVYRQDARYVEVVSAVLALAMCFMVAIVWSTREPATAVWICVPAVLGALPSIVAILRPYSRSDLRGWLAGSTGFFIVFCMVTIFTVGALYLYAGFPLLIACAAAAAGQPRWNAGVSAD
jgi:hypothetical protein